MKKRYLEGGKIVSTHGVRGEVKIQHWCDGPEVLCGLPTLYLESGRTPLEVEGARAHKNLALVKIKGIDTADAAGTLRGRVVYIDREDLPPNGEGEYFLQDLLGLRVLDADTDRVWGELTDVIQTGANDVYEVTDESGKKRLVPAIPDVVLWTDVDGGEMRIRPLEGLFDGE